MPSDHLTPSPDTAAQTLRKHFARIARSRESGAWNEDEALSGLSAAAISAVAGEREWTGQALSPDQVVQATASLPAGMRSRLHAHLLERDDVYWSDARFVMPAGGPPGRYSETFLDGVKRLRAHLRRVRTPPATA